MIISCPNCNTGFFVSPEQIGATGRRVKCSKCKNIWHATIAHETLPKSDVIAERLQSSPAISGANLPAIIPVKINGFLFSVPVILLLMISLTIWVFYPTVTSKLGLCGSLCVPNGMRIEDINYEYDLLTQKVTVEYSVANRTETKQKIPLVQLKLIDNSKVALRTVYADGGGITLDPNTSIRAKTEFNSVSAHSKLVQIALGSTVKFWFR